MQKGSALEKAMIVGLLWAGIQFVISEGAYQLAMLIEDNASADPTFLYDISDFTAWPAAYIYSDVELEMIAEELRALPVGPVTLEDGRTVSPYTLAQEVLDEPDGEFEKHDLAYETLSTLKRYPMVSATTEYAIYGGVCIAWGLLIGVITFFALTLTQSEERHRSRSLENYR